MFKNFFFVPANRLDLIRKTKELYGIDYLIFDFEESIDCSDIEVALQNIEHIEVKKYNWIRIPGKEFVSDVVKRTTMLGYNNYIIPKFSNIIELGETIDTIGKINNEARYILIIEDPRAFIELEAIIQKYLSLLHGISLGIHDFSLQTGICNDFRKVKDLRLYISIIAKAYDIRAIDVASMNISDTKAFQKELSDGFDLGYRAKLLIHPFQLNVVNSYPFYSLKEVEDAQLIVDYFEKNIKGKKVLFKYKGKVYERPHIEQLKDILNWGGDFYGTNR